jgi:hypothetical protein
LAMADGRLPDSIRCGWRRIVLAGRRRTLGGRNSVPSECHAQENGAKHCPHVTILETKQRTTCFAKIDFIFAYFECKRSS